MSLHIQKYNIYLRLYNLIEFRRLDTTGIYFYSLILMEKHMSCELLFYFLRVKNKCKATICFYKTRFCFKVNLYGKT